MFWTHNVVVGVLASILGLGSLSRGQTTNASCAPSFSWAENSLQQSPCLVAALLESQCDPFGVQVPALPASNHYTGPSSGQATTCECSTLTYMLISACGACQNRTWISWQNWSQNCPIIELSVFPVPLPPTTDVPLWAYMNISTINGTFNVEAAQNNATLSQPTSTSDNASSLSASSQTSSLLISAPISTSTTVLSSTTTVVNPTSSASSASPNHAGAIAGGVVGGLTLLVALALVLLWFCVKRKRNAAEAQLVTVQTLNDNSPKMKTNSTSHNASMSTVPTPFTYETPSSGPSSSIHTTFGYNPSLITRPYTTFSHTSHPGGPEM
ncbi:MAG: hypothetical protein NXY57DRAFT_992615 [Lentinula lateritia]|uniref:Transmembrane protein n=1 Tax=Lentinula lateritia TaxID=40482 RepID=A0ABQ8VRU2_9AGAR|nr:MAG: hypothetical protein NXY57DRAFT_992615 [Lentinula lateritia]KAJ4497939.1 hypothetical protein C8R41DRAFT_820246 [Lentinula lateritia]